MILLKFKIATHGMVVGNGGLFVLKHMMDRSQPRKRVDVHHYHYKSK